MGWIETLARKSAAFFRWVWHGRDGARTPWVRRIFAVVFFFLLPAPVFLLLVFRFVPIPGTPEMLVKLATLNPVRYSWREFDQISPHLARAVIGAEDQNFCTHNGFDWGEIQESWRAHARHPKRRLRGASTISQQTARTLFLLPMRSWIRKGAEAYLTVLVEALWPKRRILTAYLNLVDWGHGNYGAEAASETYFHKPASALNSEEAARLAAVLPNPDKWRAVDPGDYVAGRTGTLEARSEEVASDALDACTRPRVLSFDQWRRWISRTLLGLEKKIRHGGH
jgi:monofunctional biosynthetic peptidoglycan transglycosylase